MNTETKINVIIKTSNSSEAGSVRVQRLDQEQRTKRAIKTFWIGMGLMVASVFVPLFHFVLVPGFFIASPIFAYYLYKQKDMVLGGEGTCPQCKKPFPIVSGPEIWPLEDVCGLCHTHVTIEKAHQVS